VSAHLWRSFRGAIVPTGGKTGCCRLTIRPSGRAKSARRLTHALGLMVRKFQRFSEVTDLIGFMVLCCGNRFPKVGAFGDDQSENLEVAFLQLQEGLPLIAKKLGNDEKLREVENLIGASLVAYRAGDRMRGAHLLQDIENIIYPERFVEYAARKGEPL